MRYVSTRGGVSEMPFCDAVMMGVGSDGGLLVPVAIPNVKDALPRYQGLSYPALAFEIMRLFIDDIPEDILRSLIEKSYETFDDPLVTPLVQVGDIHLLELFHGPTLSFKDLALQFLGNVFAYIPQETRLNILAATSGDTGSAAIASVQGQPEINIFVMFPEGRTSSLQEKQMTSLLSDNVWNIGIEGSFDDCQSILKSIFSDLEFKQKYNLGAVNSVNWARILAQVVYYFFIYAQLGAPEKFEVAVPTGNFGNIFAGYIARAMGLPISRFILATNQNDILHRFFTTGRYKRGEVHFSHSPAMDIQVASNFERYLYFQFASNTEKVKKFMSSFTRTGSASINFNTKTFDDVFASGSATDDESIDMIRHVHDATGYIMDPHTAVGVHVGKQLRNPAQPLVCLSTAHPAKFEEAMTRALPEETLVQDTLEQLRNMPTRKTVLKAEVDAVKAFIATCNQ